MAKDNEIQSLHSKLTDTMVSKQQLEQRMLQLMENEQKRATKEDSMQMRVQVVLTDLIFFPPFVSVKAAFQVFTKLSH